MTELMGKATAFWSWTATWSETTCRGACSRWSSNTSGRNRAIFSSYASNTATSSMSDSGSCATPLTARSCLDSISNNFSTQMRLWFDNAYRHIDTLSNAVCYFYLKSEHQNLWIFLASVLVSLAPLINFNWVLGITKKPWLIFCCRIFEAVKGYDIYWRRSVHDRRLTGLYENVAAVSLAGKQASKCWC